MKRWITRCALLAILAAPAAWAGLFADNGCIGCHDVNKKKMGPTWREIAEKREGDRSTIIDAIRDGSKGAYGRIPMPPQPKASRNAEALADLILSVNESSAQRLETVAIQDAQERIRLKIRGLLRVPEGIKGNPEVVYLVRLFPNGEIMGTPEQVQSSGQPAYDAAVEAAILKASPLPLPSNPETAAVFRAELELRFRPFEETASAPHGGFAYKSRKLGETCNASKDCDSSECTDGHCRSDTAAGTEEKSTQSLASLILRYYHQAAQQGDPEAQNRLGVLSDQGQLVLQNSTQALAWFRRAAEQGYSLAQYNLGFMLLQGRGTEADPTQAATWFLKAAEQGYPNAQKQLSIMYRDGVGVTKDLHLADIWERKASQNQPSSEPGQSDHAGLAITAANTFTALPRAVEIIAPKTAKGAPRLIKGAPMFNPVWVPPGSLVLRVHVLANGEPDQVLIKESSGSNILDDEAVRQIRSARFQPGERNGQITDYWVDLPITYKKPGLFGFGASNTITNQVADSSGKQLPQTKLPDETATPPAPTYIPPTDITPPTFAFLLGTRITLTEGDLTLSGKAQDHNRIAEIRVDGQPIAFDKDGSFSVKRFFGIGETLLSFVATDNHGNAAKEIVTVVRQADEAQAVTAYEPVLVPPVHKVKSNPHSLALIVGIEDYSHTFQARHAVRDANLFYDYAQRTLGIPATNIKLLTGEKATRADLLKAIKTWLAPRVSPGKSQVVVFFAGHGLASQDGEKAFLIPQDGDPDMIEDTALDRQRLMADIAQARPQSALFFFDTCYSGGARGGGKTLVANARPVLIVPKADALPPGFMQFSAARNDQLAHSHPSQPHGLFSYYLMRGLGGEADTNHDNRLTAGELQAFVQERVQRLAQTQGRPQVPELIGDPERVIAVWGR